ncbi:MAG: hypothetical protein ACFN23_07205, partial [Capnocytophaga gingivalis]
SGAKRIPTPAPIAAPTSRAANAFPTLDITIIFNIHRKVTFLFLNKNILRCYFFQKKYFS